MLIKLQDFGQDTAALKHQLERLIGLFRQVADDRSDIDRILHNMQVCTDTFRTTIATTTTTATTTTATTATITTATTTTTTPFLYHLFLPVVHVYPLTPYPPYLSPTYPTSPSTPFSHLVEQR